MSETERNLVEYACQDHIATITLNRPEKLNAFSDDMVAALAGALRRFDIDNDAFVAIIHGAGRAFSSGADVRQRQLRRREEFEKHGGPQGWGTHAGDLLTRAVNWKPVIAAAHGYVMGLALGIVLECDLIVAEAGTQFQVTETPRGLGGAKYWALLDFRGAASFGTEMALTGRFFTAEEALANRVINRVAPEGQHVAGGTGTRPGGGAQSAAVGARNDPLAPLVYGATRTRDGDADCAIEALSERGFRRGGARVRREAEAGAIQGAVGTEFHCHCEAQGRRAEAISRLTRLPRLGTLEIASALRASQ